MSFLLNFEKNVEECILYLYNDIMKGGYFMDKDKLDKKINNNDAKNPSLDLKDYEQDVPDRKNFFSSLLNKFKTNKSQKLLTTGEDTKTHTTNRSISSLWGIGNLRASLFTSLDNVRKSISKKFSSKEPRNTLSVEIIGENTIEPVEKSVNNDTVQEVKKPPIIPNTKSKNIINNSKSAQDVRIELASINASAVEEKSEEFADKKSERDVVSKKELITSDQASLDERE